jgi:CO dehydrogenase maturation factor
MMIVVVEPGLKSLETAQRIKKLAGDIGVQNIVAVVNKVSSIEEEEFVEEKLKELSIEMLGSIPRDPAVITADMQGEPLARYPESSALKSIEEIGKKILNTEIDRD